MPQDNITESQREMIVKAMRLPHNNSVNLPPNYTPNQVWSVPQDTNANSSQYNKFIEATFQKLPMAGDNHCLPRAMAEFHFEDHTRYHEIRGGLADYLIENQDEIIDQFFTLTDVV